MVLQACLGSFEGFQQAGGWTGQETDKGRMDLVQKVTDDGGGRGGLNHCTALPSLMPRRPPLPPLSLFR